MKLKVTGKDLAIFSVFCVFLLYFSAVAVLNVFSIINDGVFAGLNPFPAFTSGYIIGTLLVFFAVLITIFFSVSSSIFETKSGIGFEIGEKEEKGYSRWLKEKEMKKAYKVYKVGVKDPDASVAGVVFINDGKNMWVDDSELHTLVIGVTGSGKTTAVVDPLIYSLCKNKESMIFTDPKGEIYKNHAELLKARGYNIVVLNFRDPGLGNAWNPLTLPYKLYKEGNVDKAIELVDDVANNIVKDKGGNNDPFWQNSSADYFSGCTLGLLEDAKEEEVNLNSIGLMTTVGEEKFGAGSNYIKEYFTMKGEQSSAYTFASNTINSPTETKGGILSTFRQKIRIFSSRENLSEMLSYSDFSVRDIGKVPTAVFMIIHDEKTTYHALATIFIKQCYETLISVAQECGGKLPVRTNFILDEFANMPALKDVTTMVTAARSRQIRFTFIIQNFAQLSEVYGKEDAETIRSNCGNLIYLLTTELAALEEISKLCGEVKNKNKDGKSESHPLVTVSDLQKMKPNEVIILRSRQNPFKTQLAQAFNIDWGDSEYGKAEFYKREKKEIQYFDIKEFVTVRKRSKMGMDGKDSKPSGGAPDFSSLFGGMGGSSGGFGGGMGLPPKPPTFEEFMAQRNKKETESVKKPNLPTFDVDDLVKRIDAKIAELEAQEKAEEEAKKNGTIPSDTSAVSPVKELPGETKVNMVESASIENVKAEPVNDDGFTPFTDSEKESTTTSFIDKDIIEEIPDPIETTPATAPTVTPVEEIKDDSVEKFDDIIKKQEIAMPEAKPSIMISNPIEDISTIPTAKEETPVENVSSIPVIPTATLDNSKVEKPLVGIIDPTKQPIINNIKEIPTQVKTIPVQTVQTNVVNSGTNSATDTKVSDDQFFDDFFDE